MAGQNRALIKPADLVRSTAKIDCKPEISQRRGEFKNLITTQTAILLYVNRGDDLLKEICRLAQNIFLRKIKIDSGA